MMRLRMWLCAERCKARLKDALGMKLTPWEDFMIEIALY